MFSIGSIISWSIFGLIIGCIARLFVPGVQPMGWIKTILLGIIGSFVGGTIGSLLIDGSSALHPGGWVSSVIGAVLILLIAGRRG